MKNTPVQTDAAPDKGEEAKDITGLDTQTDEQEPQAAPGTVAAMLKDKKLKPKPEEPQKEGDDGAKKEKITPEELDAKLKASLFGTRKPKAGAEPEKGDDQTVDEPIDEQPKQEEPKPEAKPKKKTVSIKSDKTVESERLALERERLALEKEKLELEKSRGQRQQQPEPSVETLPKELSKDELYDLEVFKAMAKVDAKYSKLADQFIKVAKSTADLKRRWERDHPGEIFNPQDEEHDEFFASNRVDYDKRDYKRAEHQMATEGHDNPRIAELEKKHKEYAARDRAKELSSVAAKSWAKHVGHLVEYVDPQIAKLVAKDPSKLQEEYPVEGPEIWRAGEALEAISSQAYLILDDTGYFPPRDGDNIHQHIINLIHRHEPRLANAPADERMLNGKEFATWSQWARMTPQEQAKHWHLGAEEVVDIAAQEMADAVKQQVTELNERINARAKRSNPDSKEPKHELKGHSATRSPTASPSSAGRVSINTSIKSKEEPRDKISGIIRKGLFSRSS